MGAEGPERLGWQDIKAWAEVNDARLGSSDGALIFAMSKAFVQGFRAEDAPYKPARCRAALAGAEMEVEAAKP